MRLKRIKLAGFKSFVDPTSIPFPNDMTAIVGPNGCGKSNVIDAVRWVLGESSAKNLRGDAMTDVIFNGSSARKPVSQCSVELVFDNSSGRIQGEYARYNELSVKRLVTRDGQSNYYLNNTKCRRRDVTDLFLGTGLGPRSYAIIEQGMISRLIESKPQELRVFIEEAAGISKYKERRRETETRIRHTRENLERLDDVRVELARQLEKLQRQAAAAKRFKQFKASEREYKSQLAAIRWLNHARQIETLEHQIGTSENEIEAFVAQQRSDEKSITKLKTAQADIKRTLEHYNHTFFKLGNDITRLEQNQHHAKQRRQQLSQDLQNLNRSIDENERHEQEDSARIGSLAGQLDQYVAQQQLCEEQFEQAEELLKDAQSKQRDLDRQWREKERTCQTVRQQLQRCHSQLQSNMQMQLRTQHRLAELEEESAELGEGNGISLHNELKANVSLDQQALTAHQKQQEKLTQRYQKSQAEYTQLEARKVELVGKIQHAEARLGALESLQESQTSNHELQQFTEKNSLENRPFVASLDVEPGWEAAVDTVCQQWQDALQLQSWPEPDLASKLPAARIFIAQNYTALKQPGTLASKITTQRVPHFFNQVLVCESLTTLMRQRSGLTESQSIVTQQGVWAGPDWLSVPATDDDGQAQGAQRFAELKHLRDCLDEYAEQYQNINKALEKQYQHVKDCETQLHDHQDSMQTLQQFLATSQNRLQVFELQQQQVAKRTARVSEELAKQRTLLNTESEQAETLTEQVEEFEAQVIEHEASLALLQEQRDALEHSCEEAQHKVEQFNRQLHQLTVQIQTTRNQMNSIEASSARVQQQLQTMYLRARELKQEQEQLELPLHEQGAELETLLEKRQEIERHRSQKSEQLVEVEQHLADAENDKHGHEQRVQTMRHALESLRLECEGHRVRAKAISEQLAEMQVELKQVLESLPEKHSEDEWQRQLDTTLSALSRLGAVNLAAVEEFELQAERKRHLDQQYDDLSEALDTLEAAIRKIDKQTRSRFKETFEQVNDDLKRLFPKVFGGGAAYLALTDDDLLETGVTIMARPPGKKNSTIHLLSGGEKALTALSLVFAIFRLNPAPFCLLDEVDAPLDDANVGRFCNLVSEMSKSVQFIYITHNKIAMEMASHLTGVTMAEPGVSRMVAVDVDEAVTIAQV